MKGNVLSVTTFGQSIMGFLKSFYLLAAFVALTKGFAQDLVIPVPEPITSLAVQANGQFLVAHGNALTRFSKGGSVDKIFTLRAIPSMLAVENDGMILVEDFPSITRFSVDGAPESSFHGPFSAFVLQPDGKLVVFDRDALSRMNPDGTLDPSFISNPLQPAFFFGSLSLGLQEDAKILLTASANGLIMRLMRFNPDGSPDPAFLAPPLEPSLVNSILVQPDGKILIGGQFQKVSDNVRNGLARLNSDGTLDSGFDPASEDGTTIFSLAMQANGKIILSGRFNSIGGQPSTNIARLNPEGTLDTSFPVGSFERPALSPIPLVLEEDGGVLAGFSTNLVRIANPEQATQGFTRVGSTLTWLRGGSSPEVFHTRFQSSLDGIVWTDLGIGKRIAGGWSLDAAAIPQGARFRVRGYVAGTSYYLDFVPGAPEILTQPSGRTNNVNTVSVLRVFAKGLEPLDFQWFKDGQALAGARSATLVLSNLTGAASGGYSVTVSNAEGSSTSQVAQLTVVDPVIFVQPTSVWLNAGQPMTLSVTAAGTALTYQWEKDGQPIPGATSSTLVIANPGSAQTGDYQVILTGSYGTLESAVVSVHVNLAVLTPWNPRYEATTEWFPIQAAAVHNNELFVGGLFRTLGTLSLGDLVKFKSDATADPAFAPEPRGDELGGVTALSVAPNGQLMVGGNFDSISGQSQRYLARLEPDGSLDPQFKPLLEGPFAGTFAQVDGIEFQPDGRILIVGDFSSVNGQPRAGVARLFPDGTLDTSFNPDADSVPRLSWALLQQPDGKIIVYGWDLRRLNADGTPDTDFTEAINADSFLNVILLPNNQLLVTSQASVLEPVVTLLNSDGTVDFNFEGPASSGSFQALQADGKFLVYKQVELIPQITVVTNSAGGTTTTTHYLSRSALFRFDTDGTEDPGFSPVFDGSVEATRADGSFVVNGSFKTATGEILPGLADLKNTEPAMQFLTFDGKSATWLRGGSSPEVTRTTFEFSSDGRGWTNLGEGARMAGGWRLGGLQLRPPGMLRARGFWKGSVYEAVIEIPASLNLEATYRPENGQIALTTTAPEGALIALQMSTDLKQWTSLQTNIVGTAPLLFGLTNASLPHAFYRLLQTTNQ